MRFTLSNPFSPVSKSGNEAHVLVEGGGGGSKGTVIIKKSSHRVGVESVETTPGGGGSISTGNPQNGQRISPRRGKVISAPPGSVHTTIATPNQKLRKDCAPALPLPPLPSGSLLLTSAYNTPDFRERGGEKLTTQPGGNLNHVRLNATVSFSSPQVSRRSTAPSLITTTTPSQSKRSPSQTKRAISALLNEAADQSEWVPQVLSGAGIQEEETFLSEAEAEALSLAMQQPPPPIVTFVSNPLDRVMSPPGIPFENASRILQAEFTMGNGLSPPSIAHPPPPPRHDRNTVSSSTQGKDALGSIDSIQENSPPQHHPNQPGFTLPYVEWELNQVMASLASPRGGISPSPLVTSSLVMPSAFPTTSPSTPPGTCLSTTETSTASEDLNPKLSTSTQQAHDKSTSTSSLLASVSVPAAATPITATTYIVVDPIPDHFLVTKENPVQQGESIDHRDQLYPRHHHTKDDGATAHPIHVKSDHQSLSVSSSLEPIPSSKTKEESHRVRYPSAGVPLAETELFPSLSSFFPSVKPTSLTTSSRAGPAAPSSPTPNVSEKASPILLSFAASTSYTPVARPSSPTSLKKNPTSPFSEAHSPFSAELPVRVARKPSSPVDPSTFESEFSVPSSRPRLTFSSSPPRASRPRQSSSTPVSPNQSSNSATVPSSTRHKIVPSSRALSPAARRESPSYPPVPSIVKNKPTSMSAASLDSDYAGLELGDRLVHKNWKARHEAYTELAGLLEKDFISTMNEHPEYGSPEILAKFIADSNLVAQEQGVTTVMILLTKVSSSHYERLRPVIASVLVEKCMGCSRTATRVKSTEALLTCIEIDAADTVLSALIAGLDHKLPKHVAACAATLKDALSTFGNTVVPLKTVVKILPKLFDHKDKTVRAEGSLLACELYRWIGPSLTSTLNDLKPVQLKELSELFEQIPKGKPAPTKLIRSALEKGHSLESLYPQSSAGKSAPAPVSTASTPAKANRPPIRVESAGGNKSAPMKTRDQPKHEVTSPDADPADISDETAIDFEEEDPSMNFDEPINVLEKLPRNFYEELNAPNWKQRKEILELLYVQLMKSTKLERSVRYNDLINGLNKRVLDMNIQVAILSIQCLSRIILGLGPDVLAFKHIILPNLLERFKEKKSNVSDVIRTAVDGLFKNAQYNMAEVLESLLGALAHKNPNIRAEALLWTTRMLKMVPKILPKTDFKPLADALVRLLDDGTESVRDQTIEALGALLRVMGDKPMAGLMERMDKKQREKVREYRDCTSCRTGGKATKAPPVKKAVSRAGSSDSIKSTKSTESAVRGKPAPAPKPLHPKASSSAPAPKPSAPASNPGPAKGKAGSPNQPILPEVSLRYTEDSGAAWLEEFAGVDMFTALSDSNWKARLDSTSFILEKVQSAASDTLEPEAIVKGFGKRPGWKEGNYQILLQIFTITASLIETYPSNMAAQVYAIPLMMDRLGDVKLKKVLTEALMQIVKNSSLHFLLHHSYDALKKQKSPKHIAECLGLINSLILEYGTNGLAVLPLIEYLGTMVDHKDPSVKTAAIACIGSLSFSVKKDILLSRIQPLVQPKAMATVEAEIARVAKLTPPPSAKPPPPPQPAVTAAPIVLASPARRAVVAPPVVAQSVQSSADSFQSATNDFNEGSGAPDEETEVRVDLASLVSDDMLAKLNDAHWKVRKEGLDELGAAIGSQKLRGNAGLEFMIALRARLGESNKNMATQSVEIVGRIAAGLGRGFDRHAGARSLYEPIISLFADQKASVRTAAITTMTCLHDAVGMSSLLTAISSSLTASDSSVLRKELCEWILSVCQEQPIEGGPALLQAMFSCLLDKTAPVRKAASAIVQLLGVDIATMKRLAGENFSGTALATLLPYLESAGISMGSLESLRSGGVSSTKGSVASSSSSQRAPGTPVKRMSVDPGSNRGASSRIVASTESIVQSVATESSSADSSSCFVTSDSKYKEARQAADRGMSRWAFDSVRKEYIDLLAEQCHPHMVPVLENLLFSNDHYKERDFMSGLCMLDDALLNTDADPSPFLAHSDLILKYITIRFFDTSTSLLMKCLDVLEHLFSTMDTSGLSLTDYEAGCFLPFFINKIGDPKETIRVKFRNIFRQLVRLYPASKIFLYVMKGLDSKNSRVRVEALDVLTGLIQKNGLNVCVPAKVLPAIGAQLADRDAGIRNAALSLIVASYAFLKDGIYKHLKITDKERTLIEERLKRLPPSAAGSNLGSSNSLNVKGSLPSLAPSAPAVREVVVDAPLAARLPVKKEFSLDLEALEAGEVPALKLRSPIADLPYLAGQSYVSSDRVSHSNLSLDQRSAFEGKTSSQPKFTDSASSKILLPGKNRGTSSPENLRSIQQEYVLDQILSRVSSGDPLSGVEAVKSLEKTLINTPSTIRDAVNEVVPALLLQLHLVIMHHIADDSHSGANLRFCKHLINVLVVLFSNEQCVKNIIKKTLEQTTVEMLNLLINADLPQREQGAQLTKALNVLMVRVLENSDRNITFSILLDTLEKSSRNSHLPPTNQTMLTLTKYNELVMKCIWKLTKAIPQFVDTNQLRVDVLLLDIDAFLQAAPPAEWKRRVAANPNPKVDLPLRTIKTILFELVSTLGYAIYERAAMIPPTSHIFAYLKAMVDGGGKTSRPESRASLSDLSSPAAVSPAEAYPGYLSTAPRDISRSTFYLSNGGNWDDRLNVIFDKISNKELTKIGIEELFHFRRFCPDANPLIERRILKSGSYFQGYIRRGLAALEEQQAGSLPGLSLGDPRSSGMTASGGLSGGSTDTVSADNYHNALTALQRKFGIKKNEPESGPVASTMPVQPSSANGSDPDSLSHNPLLQQTALLAQDRARSIAALKERLARMKNNSAA